MTAVIYGSDRSFPLSQSPIRGPALPLTPPLPGPDSPTPRRRRTIVCSNLTIEGQTWDLDEAKAKMRDALRGDKADIRCVKRPGVRIAAAYAEDVCLSSWCRSCPFAAVEAVSRPAPPKPIRPPVSPPVVLRPIVTPKRPFPDWSAEVHIVRIRTALETLELSESMLSAMLGMGAGYVHNLFVRGRPIDALVTVDAFCDRLLAKRQVTPEPPPLLQRVRDALEERHVSTKLAAHGVSRTQRTVAGVLDGTRDDPAVVEALAALVGVAP